MFVEQVVYLSWDLHEIFHAQMTGMLYSLSLGCRFLLLYEILVTIFL
ncbi:hypothetical protein FE783_08985 [Paenibacillus mesophilus]|nr:hypothetical protein FE783_08985 [Paenibacillus mesophilus]